MSKIELLQTLFEPALLQEIETFGQQAKFSEGEVIMDYGKNIQLMPIILEGTIKVYKRDDKGHEILLYYLTTGDSCSMAYHCCLATKKSEIRAVAEEDVLIVGIPQQKLDEWLCKYSSWKNYIMTSFQHRFLELLKSIEHIAFQKLDERLIHYLKEKQRITKSSVIKASHHQIAEELSTSRVVISRLLKQLENEKKLILYRNELKLLQAFNQN